MPERSEHSSLEARLKRQSWSLAAVLVLALVNAVVTMMILDNYGAAKRRIEAQDRQIGEMMDLQIGMDARLRRLERRSPLGEERSASLRP